MISKLLTFAGVMALFTVAAVALPNTASAQGDEQTKSTQTTQAQEQQSTGEEASDDAYTYVAQPGDSYSVLARKAIQTYGIDSKTDLSGAQIIFVETNLTQAAGSPLLNEGQSVAISKATVEEWVDKAKDLTDEQEAAWNVYVPYVDFDTRNNGE